MTTVVASTGGTESVQQEISYTDTKVIGNGSFGVVFQVRQEAGMSVVGVVCDGVVFC